jgi:periplasmic protein TonB
MIALAAEDLTDLRRWVISGAVVVLAHGALAAAAVWRHESEPAEPAGAIVVEFAPVPVAPANQETDIPPGPEQVASEASPDRPTEVVKEKVEQIPEQKKDEEQPPQVQPAPNPEIPIQPPKEVQLETPREEPHPPAPTTSAPQAAPVQTAAIAAAPAQGRAPQRSNAIPSWTSEIVALLERNKRYPPAAHARGEHGVAQVFFSLDRSGHVIDSKIARSSGAALLDAEALALLQRAQPFPPPPAELAGPQVNLTVPIRFNLK